MRTWCLRIAIFLAFVLAGRAETPAEEDLPVPPEYDKILFKAYCEPGSVPMKESLEAIRRTLKTKKDSLHQAIPVFRYACGRADERSLPELVEVFRLIPADYPLKGEFFVPLGQAWLRLKVPEKLEKPLKFPEVEVDVKLPKDFPAAEEARMRRYLAVVQPAQQFLKSHAAEGARNFQLHEAEFWKLVEALFDPGKEALSEGLAEYRWGGYCGTGSESFGVPITTALAMAFVAEGRWKEAAGAALLVQGEEVGGSAHLLKACIKDPADAILGGLARFDLEPSGALFGQVPLLALALELPENGWVRGLMDLAARASGESQSNDFAVLAMLTRKGSDDGGFWGVSTYGGELGSTSVRPRDQETQAMVKEFLCTQDVSRLSIAGAKQLVEILGESKWPEAIPALRRLLGHPSLAVAESAAKRLSEAGETVQMPAKLGPARYRVMVNGMAYALKRVQWFLSWARNGTGNTAMSDAEGVVEVPRDYFIDRAYGEILAFGIHSQDLKETSAPWFGVKLPVPPANDEVIPIDIKTTPVRIHLPEVRPEAELAGKTMEVTVGAVASKEGDASRLGFRAFVLSIPVAREFSLSLGPGEYELIVRVPGASTWVGKVVAGKDAEVTLPLVRASTVKYSLALPEGWVPEGMSDYPLWPELFQDGKFIVADPDLKQRKYLGVREGKYVLRFPSSKALRAWDEYARESKAPDFEGMDVPFEVKADSPLEIDLGKIRLE